MPVTVIPIGALSDNYMYLIVDGSTGQAAVVDPVEPHACIKAAQERGATIVAALTTHHHFDHAGGNQELLNLVPTAAIIVHLPAMELDASFESLFHRC